MLWRFIACVGGMCVEGKSKSEALNSPKRIVLPYVKEIWENTSVYIPDFRYMLILLNICRLNSIKEFKVIANITVW